MSQQITITIDGKNGEVRADVALKVLELVFQTLQSIDANTWAVGTQRLKWRVADASVKNPFALTYSGGLVQPHLSEPPDISRLFIDGCERIEKGEKPKYFDHDDFERMVKLGTHSKQLRALEFKNTTVTHKVDPPRLTDNARDILQNPDRIVSYGSLEGTLVKVENWPDKTGATATLLTRLKEETVNCRLTPAQADELNDYVDRRTRVILYGRITYENGETKRIAVDKSAVIADEEKLPTLRDVHALNLAPPSGISIEDFIAEIRGDDD